MADAEQTLREERERWAQEKARLEEEIRRLQEQLGQAQTSRSGIPVKDKAVGPIR